MKKNKTLWIFVAAFVAAVLILGTVLVAMTLSRRASYLVSYGKNGADEKTVSYLSSIYKTEFIAALRSSGVEAENSDAFFRSISSADGRTYAEQYAEAFRNYLSSLFAAAALFDGAGSLTADDRAAIRDAVAELKDYRAGGDGERLAELLSPYGADEAALEAAAALLYKAGHAEERIYGADGSGAAFDTAALDAELEKYVHVKLLFVRTASVLVLDERGEQIIGPDGRAEERDLSPEEILERERRLAEIRAAIAGSEDVEISPEAFDLLVKKYDEGGSASLKDGYYLRTGTVYGDAFAENLGKVVEKAGSMKIGEYGETVCSVGVCFLYRYAPTAGAYASTDARDFFTDFLPLAARAAFSKAVGRYAEDVTFAECFDAEDFAFVPQNSDMKVRFSK